MVHQPHSLSGHRACKPSSPLSVFFWSHRQQVEVPKLGISGSSTRCAGLGIELSHSSHPSCCRGNAGSLTLGNSSVFFLNVLFIPHCTCQSWIFFLACFYGNIKHIQKSIQNIEFPKFSQSEQEVERRHLHFLPTCLVCVTLYA